MEWIYLLAAGVLEVTWAVFMKMSEGFSRVMPSMVKEISAHHGGSVSVSSAPGRGSTFTFSLPLRR